MRSCISMIGWICPFVCPPAGFIAIGNAFIFWGSGSGGDANRENLHERPIRACSQASLLRSPKPGSFLVRTQLMSRIDISLFDSFSPHASDFARGVRASPFDSVDLYNVMCHVTGLLPAPNNGSWDHVTPFLSNHSPASLFAHQCTICSIQLFFVSSLVTLLLLVDMTSFSSVVNLT